MKFNPPVVEKSESPFIGCIRVTVHQSLKASANWNSAEATYGMQFDCRPEDFDRAVEQAETLVEKALAKKHTMQMELLGEMGKGR